jgi:hypothetical protein
MKVTPWVGHEPADDTCKTASSYTGAEVAIDKPVALDIAFRNGVGFTARPGQAFQICSAILTIVQESRSCLRSISLRKAAEGATDLGTKPRLGRRTILVDLLH